jgi:hypothetical protein
VSTLFSGTIVEENTKEITKNLSKQSGDKELISRVSTKEITF